MSGTTSTTAPVNGASKNCHTAMSNEGDAVCAMTSPGPRFKYGTLLSWFWSMPRISTKTPLGAPVEPEV